MTMSAEQAPGPVDRHQYELALTSLYVTGLELTDIAACCPPELRALLMEHLEDIEVAMAAVRASLQTATLARQATRDRVRA